MKIFKIGGLGSGETNFYYMIFRRFSSLQACFPWIFLIRPILKREKIALNLECSPISKLWAFSGTILIQRSHIQSV
jgi:hypothetical protein